MPAVSLISVPQPLRHSLSRRLPKGPKFKDLTGIRFGCCKVVGFAGYKGAFAAWLCRCQCGKLFVREGAYLVRRGQQACGCLRTQKNPIPKYLRVIWSTMRDRCYNPGHRDFCKYGKLGIKVCRRWRSSLEKFAEDMGPRPSCDHVFCRRDGTGDFTPANCFWGTRRDRPSDKIRYITYGGRTRSISAWADELGISRQAMHYRVNLCLRRGLEIALALTKPPRKRRRRSAKRHDG